LAFNLAAEDGKGRAINKRMKEMKSVEVGQQEMKDETVQIK
jgi:hypothetical protein